MSEICYEDWQPVIGLEIHAQLNTKSKLFSPAANHFGDEPNTNISTVCTGQPGALPVLNKEAVHKAVLFGCAVGSEVSLSSQFDRKSYFYPDSPRNFQITQFYKPILVGGTVVANVGGVLKHFSINRSHLEDDAGTLKHFSTFTGVDYNRAGVALIEIVSEPCMHAPKEAVAYSMAIKAILEYLDVSDCNMDEGSFRIDCNISVRKKEEQILRTKIEIKNLNSFNNMEMALESEIRRQIREYTLHPQKDFYEVISQGTYRFDPEKKETVLMREKEDADDYRYFPEPDLPPILLKEEEIKEIKANLPELPYQRYNRYLQELELPESAAAFLINDKKLADYFEEALKICFSPKNICNWMIIEFAGRFKDTGSSLICSGIGPSDVGKLVKMIESNVITGKIAKSVADDMCKDPGTDPEKIVKQNPDYQPLQDISSITLLVDKVLENNPQSISDFHAGKARAFDFLVGQVMKLCKGKASPTIVNEILTKKLKRP
ncbi:Asp-tRNA(Asn)/Glu-tRNA(Gln) amidotransferase subunit GatB [Candidatus Rhabdochlamydia porcellionis]|uniref:Aspartyl/glutamyl-tRNA(Asn/Gln) amidotransferase subunit B n=1 Tax=Candidatus Rhabdochlamydia porcellionis TaxID=225148 RepID=A0ABX8YZP5_9BACT|nr:Asp-tRNA(Asn)/Glu-tRNA(Gln) amidotransferase subunit GatB [Candidatus Rhabdochlamydia porcellionis]QZA58874.1 Aspartyl/glutamyl-tRNA(Asn/Gln) amidotransferasesubunit B [Candidatus Rhabdochlamydia porcellionis]